MDYPTITLTEEGEIIMKISKIKVIAKYLTGGVASVVEYVLDLFNETVRKLPRAEVAKYAQLAKDVANFVTNVANALVTDERKKAAAVATAQAFDRLATALIDCEITKEEIDSVIGTVKVAVEAWKAVK